MLGNALDAVSITDASNTMIGPSNVLSGNGTNGQQGAGVEFKVQPHNTTVFLNLIGTDATGKLATWQFAHGVFLGDGVHDNTIGPGNVISGNGSSATQGVGVYVFGPSTTGIRSWATGSEQTLAAQRL